jgi:cytochrome c peroxidase
MFILNSWLAFATSAFGQESIIPITSHLLPTFPQEKLALGEKLFHDTLMSSGGALACATCHPIDNYTTDGVDFLIGDDGKPLDYNTPSITYASLNQYLGWMGNISDFREHLEMLIHNPREMNTTWPSIIQRLKSTEHYSKLFVQAGYKEINTDSIVDAIISFETSLVKPSRFDLYLLGDKNKLNTREIEGYQLFKEYGCISCHQGINIGGNMRQTFGVMSRYYSNSQALKPRDYGYYNITGQEDDKFLFKVPSLRNVSKTAPYFHDASAKTLQQAIKVMFEFQLGLTPTQSEINSIAAFLNTLDATE